MYRILLVEDEEIIRKGIRYSVPWKEYRITAESRNQNRRTWRPHASGPGGFF